MARIEKRTRIKGLPPRVLLSARSSMTGSYPLVIHGDISVLPTITPYRDQNTLVFTGSSVYYGLGVPTDSIYIPSLLNLTTSLTGSANTQVGIADEYLDIPKYVSGSFLPFKDNFQFGADGKSQNSAFFATGTNIEGLTAPVWSKNKVEISLNVASSSSIVIRRDVAFKSYPMGYYNFASQTWEGIGLGYDPQVNQEGANYVLAERQMMISTSCVGFAPSLLTPRDSPYHVLAAGEPIGNWGFPYGTKFHATSSQLFGMKNLLKGPFLVEKFVLLISATFSGSVSTWSESFTRDSVIEPKTNLLPLAANTFFFMNQRGGQKFLKPYGIGDSSFSVFTTQICPSSSQLSIGGPDVLVDTVRDLIGYANVVSYASTLGGTYSGSAAGNAAGVETFNNRNILDDLTTKELLISTGISGTAGMFWGPKQLTISGTATMPTEIPSKNKPIELGGTHQVFGTSDYAIIYIPLNKSIGQAFMGNYSLTFVNDFAVLTTDFRSGGRNGFGVDKLDNRSLLPVPQIGRMVGSQYGFDNVKRFDALRVPNPYLLLPTDNLVVGWQLPFAYGPMVASVSSSNVLSITFHPGEAKLILYGSYMSEGVGVNDTLNQVLFSEDIHEAIE